MVMSMTTTPVKGNLRRSVAVGYQAFQKVASVLLIVFFIVLIRHPHVEKIAVDIGMQAGIPDGKQGLRSTAASQNRSCLPTKGLRPLRNRDEIGSLLEEFQFRVGAEIGVQRGLNTKELLTRWKSCETFHLIDLWAQQKNYEDAANVDDMKQESIFETAQRNLKPWESKTTFHRMLSTEAAMEFEPESLDYIYVDARHDYCGVMEDLEYYWPLLKPGGIMAGHDFKSATEVKGQDWGLCMDGTRNEGAVKGAVLDFFLSKGVTVSVPYEDGQWPSWIVQKPLCEAAQS
uniref:Methyltransferase domain-containing protein n=1 Tax=Amphora coffeiformis TaxID=265554 RepID=A0A7S3L567_9STRA|mmetsp:Transcript_10915/g.22327  ORF Transcript_10915/g.22327 Transcript_10915/m.22327 type:complete len:288 (+) Transcript_10915:133-996(+)|eukprot:scaffold4599_cov219-Amphora_coffeaeformis.AAC.11